MLIIKYFSLCLDFALNAARTAEKADERLLIYIYIYLIPQNSKRGSESKEGMNPTITSSKSKAELASVNSEMTGNENQIINY
ncbi:MAG: hypothetical protein J6B57_04550, partial [Oscillospiraceae bacterium]|nr:hypothetical protein [Oscillospiraceae bacterium]